MKFLPFSLKVFTKRTDVCIMSIYKAKSGVSMANFNAGDKAYIIDNRLFLREVTIIRVTKDLCTIKYIETGTCIRVRRKRLFFDIKDAEKELPVQARPKRPTHWDYEFSHL